MVTLASIERRLSREEVVLLRRAGTPDLEVHAKVRGYSAQELIGEIQQGDREVRISNKEIREASWPGPPRRGDKITINPGVTPHVTTVQSVETRELYSDPALHIIQVRGG